MNENKNTENKNSLGSIENSISNMLSDLRNTISPKDEGNKLVVDALYKEEKPAAKTASGTSAAATSGPEAPKPLKLDTIAEEPKKEEAPKENMTASSDGGATPPLPPKSGNSSSSPKKRRRKKKKSSNRPKGKKSTFVLAIIVWVIIAFGIIGVCGAGYLGYKMMDGKPTLNYTDLESPDSTKIYDKNGEIIIELGQYLRENISYEQMPSHLVDAFLAVEDSRYFVHFGFDIPRFTKAILANLKSGGFGQGGSTVTMQLVKNSYFQIDDGENSTMAAREGMGGVQRKAQEIILSIEANYKFDKKDILALFINKVNYGNNIRGIQKAAEYYFGKPASELTLSESAFLAGIINAPNAYNPYNGPKGLEAGQRRRDEVLDLMVYHGYITEEEADLAKSEDLENLVTGISEQFSASSEYYQSYIDAVIDEAERVTGKNPYTTSMQIYTNMDKHMQEEVFMIQNDQNPSLQFTKASCQNALVIMNNQTGELIALGGGRKQSGTRMFNRATSAYLQPGSSIKPIFEYALAFEKLGWATSHTICDMPVYLYGSDLLVANAGGQGYTGDMLLTEAVARSLNTPAIQTVEAVIDKIDEKGVVDYLNSIGIRASLETFDIQYAIGGASCLVTPVQLAAAHAMLMNKGMYVEPHTINHIDFADGTTYVADTIGNRVLSEGAAWLTAYLEQYNVSGDFFNYMQILRNDYPVFAKTGTTDWGTGGEAYGIPTGAPKDSWLVCQTSNYTVSIWLGFDQAGPDTYFTTYDDNYNLKGKIGKYILQELKDYYNYEPHALPMPDSVTEITHVRGAYPYAEGGGYPTVRGYILKSALEENPLVPVSEVLDNLEDRVGRLTGMGINDAGEGFKTITWYGFSYAGGDQEGVCDISATNYEGDTTPAVGRCYFPHYKSFANPEEYYADVYVDGNPVGQITSPFPMTQEQIEGATITVCGWTSWSAEQKCETFPKPKDD